MSWNIGCLAWKSLAENSWEPESSLPKELVTEYEEGIMREVIDDNFTSGYQIIHTLSSAVIEYTDEPQEKRPRMDKSFSPHSTGLTQVTE